MDRKIRMSGLIIIILIILGCNTSNESIEPAKRDKKQAQIAFNEIKKTLNKDGGKLWNHSLDGPILVVNPETRIIIGNEPDKQGELKKQGKLFIGSFPENRNIGNTSIEWNDTVWAMVELPLPKTKEERMNLILHELFHRIQPELKFNNLSEIQNVHLDTKNGRIFLKLEMLALKEALQSNDFEKHIRNALLFRQYRHHLFQGSEVSENSLEINEGIAEYTSSTLSGWNDASLKRHYSSEIDLFLKNSDFIRSFPYYAIPVYGYFMKNIDNYWNLKINEQTNLTAFISSFFKAEFQIFDHDELMKIGKSYQIDSIISKEEIREIKSVKQKERFKIIFLNDSVLTIPLENMNIEINTNNIPLEPYGFVYPSLRIVDNWGILVVDSCGALINTDWKKVTVTHPTVITDTLIKGSGWKLKLNKSWTLEINNTRYLITN